MLLPSRLICFVTILAYVLIGGFTANAQSGETEKYLSMPAVIAGHPFSAIKYTRTVTVQPSGHRIVASEAHRLLLARDTIGSILLSGTDQVDEQCDIPALGNLKTCDHWTLSLFDPSNATMWHWGEGEIADKTQLVQMDLTSDQMAEAERLTSVIPTPPAPNSSEPEVRVEKLGERDFEGIPAEGIRITTIHGLAGISNPGHVKTSSMVGQVADPKPKRKYTRKLALVPTKKG